MRRPFIAGNWKMHKTVHDTVSYIDALKPLLDATDDVDVVAAPTFLSLHAAAAAAKGSRIRLAAQDLYWEREGAFTGEVSGPMLRDAGADFVIIGHSERRTLFGETDASVNRKTAAAFAASLTPIVCIGETLDQRERQETFTVLDRQIKLGLDGFGADALARMVVAYEPVWAIGTGRNATAAQAAEAHGHIRSRIRQWFGGPAADSCRIIYGGSVKADNAADLLSQPDVDGALVGGASLDPRTFAEIVSHGRRTRV
jgi:triosephosphate isomerase